MFTYAPGNQFLLRVADWPKAYSEFSKLAPVISSSGRLYNNYVKDRVRVRVMGYHVMHDRGA